MPPTKRKTTLRRQVLDIKGEDSSSKSAWQTKYQYIQLGDGSQHNGDSNCGPSETLSPTNSAKVHPLSGLVGNYNSDSEGEDEKSRNTLDAKVEDFLKEIQSISSEPPIAKEESGGQLCQQAEVYSTASKWQQCYDQNSGYPYYWNVETNEVTWEMPAIYAEIKAAAASTGLHQHEPKLLSRQSEVQLRVSIKNKKEPEQSAVLKYPWEGDSDSEEEKFEVRTPSVNQSKEEKLKELEEEDPFRNRDVKAKRVAKRSTSCSQLPVGPDLPPHAKRTGDLDETEGESLNDSSYETSSLLTHRVPDTGPPGDEGFSESNEMNSESKNNVKISTQSEVPRSSPKKETHIAFLENLPKIKKTGFGLDICGDVKEEFRVEPEPVTLAKTKDNSKQDFADNVIAEIEKEMPPDYKSVSVFKTEQNSRIHTPLEKQLSENQGNIADTVKTSGISGIALLASYDDDSESEEGSMTEKRKKRETVKFAGSIPEERVKPLFPCIEADFEKQEKKEMPERKAPDSEVNNIYESDVSLESSMHKAFKRKKRIEFATTVHGPSTSTDVKSASPEYYSVATGSQYDMDPTSNDHRGFGFTSGLTAESNNKSSKIHGNWIQFVKTETINLVEEASEKQKAETVKEAKQDKKEEDSIATEEIVDAASLLKEKVTFLTGGKEEISPIQHISIQLETLFIAWQQGALSKVYFFRWVKEKCSDLSRHEKSAAPPGWTCLWDRKTKRYFYRNVTTKVIQWDYPNVNEVDASVTTAKTSKEPDVPEGGGEEMELCFTPPHVSTEENRVNDDQPATPLTSPLRPSPPPPPAASDIEGQTLKPSLPHMTFLEVDTPKGVKSTMKKEAINSPEEDDADGINSVSDTAAACTESEEVKDTPPLPPLPPPPPPPPDEPPPPLPNSPPPLPIDRDQPLPPGVDEPEYAMFCRLSPKQNFKSQPDTFAGDIMMTYGYAMNTPSVATIAMQPLEYHGYVHDPSHYIVQSAPTSHIIHCPAKKSKLSLSSELDSFYSDIALLESSRSETTAEKPASEAPPLQDLPVSAPELDLNMPSLPAVSGATPNKHVDNSASNGPAIKKRKKTKLTPGLSMRKKGVSSLVAKWQQVQQEVRRDLNSDADEDDEDATAIHK